MVSQEGDYCNGSGLINKQQEDKNSESKHSQGNRRKTYYYGCGDPNHLLPDCSHKASLKVVHLRNSSPDMVIDDDNVSVHSALIYVTGFTLSPAYVIRAIAG